MCHDFCPFNRRLKFVTPSLQTVGVIFKTERDSFRVLDQNGQVRIVQPHQITMGRDSRRAIATDADGHELRVDDNVKEIDGEVCAFRLQIIGRT